MDLNGAVWTVPAERMKMGNRHRVPLSPRAVAILREAEKVRCGDYVFPAGEDRPFSNMVFAMLLRRLHVTGATPHGFRSSFRTWVFEETDFPRDLAEVALAHGNEDKVEAAYRLGDALEKRRAMMAAWADFIEPRKADNVTPMRRRGGKRRNESEA
jgi:integrase